MNNDFITVSGNGPRSYSIGRLGAVADYIGDLQSAREDMIERRILRIEMAMRLAGIEVEDLALDSAP